MAQRLQAYMIGGQSLLVQCAQAWLDAGHALLGIVSSDPAAVEWARTANVPVLALDADTADRLSPCDYIFSIANLRLLPAGVLSRARAGAVNFHDGPLPRYAGLHATTWALIGRERTHGITWHLIEDGIDEGRILLQETFAVADDETALTLNAKCYEAGLRTFPRLVEGLAAGTLRPTPQDLSARTYFGAFARPAAACALDFDRDAADVAAFVRALDFGTYPNPIGAPWVQTPAGVLRVSRVEVLPVASGAAPGTIVETEAGLVVTTRTADIRLTRLSTSDGLELSPAQAAARFGLARGVRLSAVDAETGRRLSALHERAARHEPFWAARLAARAPLDVPYIRSERLDRRAGPLRLGENVPPPAVGGILPDASAGERLLAAIVLHAARLTRTGQFDLGLSTPSLRASTAGLEPWFATTVPMRLELALNDEASSGAGRVLAALREADERVGFLRDLAGRTPARAASRAPERPRWAVRLALVDELPEGLEADDREAALSIYVTRGGDRWRWVYDEDAVSAESVALLRRQVATIALQLSEAPSTRIDALSLMSDEERRRVLKEWNATALPYDATKRVHEIIAAQARTTPDRPAVIGRSSSLTYAELDARANALAHVLVKKGVGPNVPVGICASRSPDLTVALLAILKAGGAYVPLDPEYPSERLSFMLKDAGARLLVLDRASAGLPLGENLERVLVDDAANGVAEPPHVPGTPDDLMYVIYTSGSTGQPKGVMVTHRNVVNLFAGLDEAFAHDRDGVWLALTSLSFDISVLELFWTLARGFSVALHRGAGQAGAAAVRQTRPITFSLFYFASDEGQPPAERYRLLIEGAKFADAHGFEAVWTPERHFHAFGGLYPNPSVASAALAVITRSVKIRAGSVVLPLHHPARVAEEWAVVDNLSSGRVGISFASGWQPDDFVLKPEAYADAKALMMRHIETVRRLWRGEAVTFDGPRGPVEVRTLPRPVQPDLPVWITSAGNPETFRMAGEAGAYVLTHLLGQSIDELGVKLRAYRDAWKAAGHAGDGHVTLMLHTFIGESDEAVRAVVRQPMKRYLASSMSLIKGVASTFPAFKKLGTVSPAEVDALFAKLGPDDLDALTEHAFERYYETGGLFGTVDDGERIVESLRGVGVDEVACLIDFGVDTDTVLGGLEHLERLRARVAASSSRDGDESIGDALRRTGATHLQCTPSLAAMLLRDAAVRPELSKLSRLLVGGEALPPDLAAELASVVGGSVHNMYGPTETTVWSAMWTVPADARSVAIGRPLVNTRFYVLDDDGAPVPVGTPGELYIGGDGVSPGYWKQPSLTAERFVPDRFGDNPQARLYRTGDLVRYLPDGRLEFLGRLDHQVKVRGYRIELGEIEHALAEAPGVRTAVVVRREDRPGDVRLVAYVQMAEPGAPLDERALRERLRARLPAFMVPSHVVALPAFPLTPNGKIDRRRLPAPESAPLRPAGHHAPETAIERTLVGIWRDLLGVSSVGIDENFFDLGGHSLLAVQALARIREVVPQPIAITDLFRFPTIRGLARHLTGTAVPSAALEQAQARASRRLAVRRRDR